MEYRGWRISRGTPNRRGERTWVAVRGNVALQDLQEVKLKERIDARVKYDALMR